ncbi:MAG: Rrf2 family transcriptional regulator [Rhodospirillales bacterium]|jgi:Rrf2 family protein|nr:Rrf2 family transcriptional regulator [Rhodospirillales bacterium]
MLRLSKKMWFTIEAVVDIAFHAGGQPVQSHQITRRQGIPKRYLEQALQQLVRAGILTGIRGPQGGYRLARERRRISIGEVVRVVQGMENQSDPLAGRDGSELATKVIHPLLMELQDNILARLDDVTVADLCNRADRQGVAADNRPNLDFNI